VRSLSVLPDGGERRFFLIGDNTMNWLDDMFAPIKGLMAIYRLGFVPKDSEFYELTSEQYDKYFATAQGAEEHVNLKLYMVLPDDIKTCNELTSDAVFVITEKDIAAIKSAEELIEKRCANSGKEFSNVEEKLRYCAPFFPSVATKGTKYERYNGESHLSLVTDE